MTELAQNLLGGRFVSALTGSAPISAEVKAFVESLLDIPLVEGYGSTEAGIVYIDGRVRRPLVIDYKLVDVPDLGYFHTDQPHPRGELLVKTKDLFPGYYKRPEVTAEVFDPDGYYRTGDVVAEVGPDQLVYLDRRNNVLKLSQGEFVTVSKLEAVFGDSPLVRQIYVYGNSARSYLLAVVVPTEDALSRRGGDVEALKPLISESLQDIAKDAGPAVLRVPARLHRRDNAVHPGERPAHRHPQAGAAETEGVLRRSAWSSSTPSWQTVRPTSCARCARTVPTGRCSRPSPAPPVRCSARRPAIWQPDAHFTDLGGDSLSALTFGNLLHEIFDIDVPVGVIVSPASDLQAIADYIETERSPESKRPTFAVGARPRRHRGARP